MNNGNIIKNLTFVAFLTLGLPGIGSGQADSPVPLTKLDLKAMITDAAGWKLAGKIWFDPSNKKRIIQEDGDEILFSDVANAPTPLDLSLGTGNSLYIEFEYMLSADAQIQLNWGQPHGLLLSTPDNKGTASTGHGALTGSFTYPARVDASRASGLWQRARIWVSADGTVYGVEFNDLLVHRNVRPPQAVNLSAWKLDLRPTGPVAFRNIQYALLSSPPEALGQSFDFATSREIVVTPTDQTIVQRCFIQDGAFKRTYCVAVGDPSGTHYVVDQAQAALLGMWNGEFYDASTMWVSRGNPQVAQPLGNIIWFDGKPLLATLDGPEAAWPDSAQSGLTIKGYDLDSRKRPVFSYLLNDIALTDKITPIEGDSRTLERIISITNVNQPNVWLRVATGKEIRDIGKGRYVVNDMQYYLQMPQKGIQTRIRTLNGISELLVSVTKDMDLSYSVYW